MRVIGTAGHVDHGKSTLVEALTGIHPDRLKEEREREMTIDLGFAWLTLPGGEEVGIIDVPGHRDFIENMLAGIGGIDVVLFVVAADEGVMPQTREHLAILDILQVGGGVVALTKVDLIDDPGWLDLIEEDLRNVLDGTILAESPIIRVSARTKQGLPDLIQALSACLSEQMPRPDLNRPRLSIDRVFSMIGFGTVVTGTLIDGSLRVGDELMILPSGLRGRIRGLQAHQHKEDIARPGSRTAINISGIDMNQIQRGNVVTHPGDYIATRRLDVRFGLLKDVIKPLTHNMQVKFFIGAAETIGRVRLLGDEALQPGKDGWLQLELVQPVIAVRGDHYILRRPSPGETLGGGVVLDAHPKGRHKRFSNETLTRLETLAHGDPSDVILEVLLYNNAAPIREIVQASRLEEMDAKLAINTLFAGGNLIDLESKDDNLLSIESDALVASRRYWEDLSSQLIFEVESYHRSHPFRLGMSREELKSRLKLSLRPELASRLFIATLHKLTKEGLLVEVGPYVQIKGHVLHFPPQQQQKVDILLNRFASTPYAPPSVKDCIEEVGEEIYNALVELERLLPVSQEVVFRKEDYEEMVRQVLQLISKNMTVTAAQVRDHFDTSRRFALALLEYMDQQGLTVRDGDIRRIKSKGGNPAG